MKFKRILSSAVAGILAAVLLCPSALAASSADVISAALNEVGYTESASEYTKFGAWYGLPNSYWCDMFISWCAMKAGISSERFPRQCSCTTHVRLFQEQGRYRLSAARGGSYLPQQGDVIFFYNNVTRPAGNVVSHTGLVLYAADGFVYTIEGNALTNRLDWSNAEVWNQQDGKLDPLDRVTVNRYPLNAPHIHGYGVPNYDDRTPLKLDGFVDLSSHADDADIFQVLSDMGVMPATSVHTFSPDHGVTRGDFMLMVTTLFGLPDNSAAVMPFDDVPADSPYYSAVMMARSIGILNGAADNLFQPDLYISSVDAQVILNRLLAYFKMPIEFFTLSGGDFNYMLNPYTIRADIAKALYSIHCRMPLSEEYVGYLTVDHEEWTTPVRKLGGVTYLPVWFLQEAFPNLEVPGITAPLLPPERTEENMQQTGNTTEQVQHTIISLRYAGVSCNVNSFICQDILYIPVQTAAQFLPLDLTGVGDLYNQMFPTVDESQS